LFADEIIKWGKTENSRRLHFWYNSGLLAGGNIIERTDNGWPWTN